jgi:chemosensory pili system protein ChpA (sensor histidine kinase/response regulator)
MDDLFRLCGELSVHGAAHANALKGLAQHAQGLLAQLERVQRRVFEIETQIDSGGAGRLAEAHGDFAGFDALELDRYGELHTASRALAEEASDARAMALQLDDAIGRLGGLHQQQQRLSQELHYQAMTARMTTVGAMEPRWHRTVHATCQATDKEAVLQVEGGDTLIDSDVLGRLAEPLLHLLRNAVDHGLESPAEREALGKPRFGTIRLRFERQGQQVLLRCEDDGRGLDLEAIRRRAAERGLLSADRPVSDDEAARLILLPGFSSRQQVSETSGRGVGLDVVNAWAAGMQGGVRVISRPGQGCTLELRFAATLSTIAALIVEAGGQRYAIPSLQVEQAVARGLGRFAEAAGSTVFHHADRVLPAVTLRALVQPGAPAPAGDTLDAVIVRAADKLWAIGVERLVDARELLVKPAGRYARQLAAVAGLSILADGSVAVHLDLHALLREASPRAMALEGGATAAAPAAAAAAAGTAQRSVLIVDDSMTVRAALSRLMERLGFGTTLARDGLEALRLLRDVRPDLVLTDLEMPEMNGVELTRHIRGDAALRGLPVIMITSRSQDKHRELARAAGVDGYMTKPFNDEALAALVHRSLQLETAAS